jgi:hypothetical protein
LPVAISACTAPAGVIRRAREVNLIPGWAWSMVVM